MIEDDIKNKKVNIKYKLIKLTSKTYYQNYNIELAL